MTAYSCNRSRILSHGLLGSFPSLTSFATDLLASVANSLAMIWLRWSDLTDFGCSLSDYFAIITIHLDLTRFLIHLKRNSSWWLYFHRMGITNEQCQILSLHFRAVTHPIYFKHSNKTRTDTTHHIGDHSPSRAMQRAFFRIIRFARDDHFTILQLNADLR